MFILFFLHSLCAPEARTNAAQDKNSSLRTLTKGLGANGWQPSEKDDAHVLENHIEKGPHKPTEAHLIYWITSLSHDNLQWHKRKCRLYQPKRSSAKHMSIKEKNQGSKETNDAAKSPMLVVKIPGWFLTQEMGTALVVWNFAATWHTSRARL